MFKIETTGLNNVAKKLKKFNGYFQKAREKALYEAGNYASNQVRFFVETGGGGTWKPPHPVTKNFSKSGGSFWRKEERPGNFYGLGKFSRFMVTKANVITGFGSREKSGIHKFSRPLMGYAKSLLGQKIPVTKSMRRRFAATGNSNYTKERTTGVSFFPIKKTTTILTIPQRLIRFDVQKIITVFKKTLGDFF